MFVTSRMENSVISLSEEFKKKREIVQTAGGLLHIICRDMNLTCRCYLV